MVVSAIVGAYSAYSSYKQGVATRKYYNYLAQQNEEEAKHVRKVGDRQSELIQDTAKLKGLRQKSQAMTDAAAQKAAMVANGMDLSSVSAGDIASDSISKAKLDEIAIRYNADVQSWQVNTKTSYQNWALQTKATQNRYAGEAAFRQGKQKMTMTLLTTAASIAGTAAFAYGGLGSKIGSIGNKTVSNAGIGGGAQGSGTGFNAALSLG